MSTKTTFKRVAAVAAAALAIGGLSAVSAHATTSLAAGNTIIGAWNADGITGGLKGTVQASVTGKMYSAANGVAGPANTVTVAVGGHAGDQTAGTNNTGSGSTKRSILIVSGGTITGQYSDGAATTAATEETVNTAGTQASIIKGNAATYFTIATTVAGTVTASIYLESVAGSGIYGSTAAETVTFTINATGSTGVVSVTNSTIWDTTTPSTTPDLAGTAATTLTVDGAINTSRVHYLVTLQDGNTNSVSKVISASVAGPGLVSLSDAATGGGKVAASSSASSQDFYLFGDGSSGTATITFSAGSVVLGTKTVNFFGSTVASISATQVLKVASTAGGTLGNNAHYDGVTFTTYPALVVALKDVNGNLVGNKCSSVKISSSDTTVFASAAANNTAEVAADANGVGYCDIDLTALANVSGSKADITAYVLATDGVTHISASPLTFALGGTTAYSAVITSGADSYAPGDKVTLTATLKDKAGNAVADQTYGLLTAVSGTFSTSNTQALTPSATITTVPFSSSTGNYSFVGGVKTSSFYAPYTSGTLILSGLVGTSHIESVNLAGSAISASISVTNPADASAQAAIDAAQEATDAANAAYDAANNAMDSADAATAAAQDASDNASAALAAVTSLSATVAKLVKSVAAIAAALAKVQKKIGA